MVSRVGVLVLASLPVFACKKPKSAVPPPAPESPAADHSLFIVARGSVERAQLPARFAAPLPTSKTEIEHSVYAPRPFIRASLEADTHDMRTRFVDGLTRAAASGPPSVEVTSFYTDLVGYRPKPAVCEWLVETGSTVSRPAAVRDVAWQAATGCQGSILAVALTRDGVPDRAIVDWYFNLDDDDAQLPYSERAAQAATSVARTATDDFDVRKVGFVFAHMSGPESVAAITKLQREIGDARRAALVGVGMLRHKSPAGIAVGQRACKHPINADDTMCTPSDPVQMPADLPGLVDAGEEPEPLLAKFPRADVAAEYARCARAGDFAGEGCFRHLLEVDRDAAIAIAKQLVSSDDDRIAVTARSVLKYPDLASAKKALVDLGFPLDKPRDSAEKYASPPITVQDLLVARGRTEFFDTETDMFPNEHDALLVKLAALAKPTLDTVVFEEIPPGDSDIYMLHAYVDGLRYSVRAQNHGDWYDVGAVVGLLNKLLEAKKSDIRMVVLATGDQYSIVLAGPARGIETLVGARLLDLDQPGESERVGKDAEDRAFEELQKQSHDVIHRDVRVPTK